MECGCRRGHRSTACEWRRACPADRPEERTTRSKRRCPIQICDASSPTRPIRTARITSPGASPTRAVASRFTAICNCGNPVSCSARRSVSRRRLLMSASACSANRESSSRSGPKIRTSDVGRGPAEPFIDPHAEWCREQDRDTRHPFLAAPACRLRGPQGCACGLASRRPDVRQCVRHRIFRALRATCSSHHVLNLQNLAQDVFDPMIQAIDFLECGLGGKHGLQKERPLIQLRHEVTADAKPRAMAGTATRSVTRATSLG